MENHRAAARKLLMKVSGCSGTGWCGCAGTTVLPVGCGAGEVPPCGSAAAALWAPVALMEEAEGDGGTELLSDGAPWERRCPDGRSSSPFLQESQQAQGERVAARK